MTIKLYAEAVVNKETGRFEGFLLAQDFGSRPLKKAEVYQRMSKLVANRKYLKTYGAMWEVGQIWEDGTWR